MENKLIYNQKNLPEAYKTYGLRNSGVTGCGWVATYNALILLGRTPDPQKIIKYYEKRLPIINGNFGTVILNVINLFKQLKYKVKVTDKRAVFDEIAKESDVCIMFYHWRKNYKFGAHYVALHYDNGKFIGYNTFINSNGPDDYGESLEEFILRRKYFGVTLIGIMNKV